MKCLTFRGAGDLVSMANLIEECWVKIQFQFIEMLHLNGYIVLKAPYHQRLELFLSFIIDTTQMLVDSYINKWRMIICKRVKDAIFINNSLNM